jgi:hypothetical protein
VGQRLESHTKTLTEGGFPPESVKPRPFEKGRGLEKRLKPLLKDKKGLGLLVKKSLKEKYFLWKRPERDKTLLKCCTFASGKRSKRPPVTFE